MPKVKKERTKYHHAACAKNADSSDDEDLKELGLVFKGKKKSISFEIKTQVPPPKLPVLTENPFSGEVLEDDRMSMASSRMSSRSSTSRLGRDGDGKVLYLVLNTIKTSSRMWRKNRGDKRDANFSSSDWIFRNKSSKIWKIMCKFQARKSVN